jgi:hypothetical protein
VTWAFIAQPSQLLATNAQLFSLTRKRSLVQSQYRAPQFVQFRCLYLGIWPGVAARGQLAADSVIEIEMGSEIPRDANLRDYRDEDDRDQSDEQSDGARPGADRRNGQDQK